MVGSSISLIVICIFIMPPILRGFYINFQYGLVVIFGLFLLEAFTIGLQPLHLGLNIFPPDVLFSVLLIIGLLRLLHYPWRFNNKVSLFWLALGALIFLSLLRGVWQFGTSSVVEFRENFYFWASSFYLLSFQIGIEKNDFKRITTLFSRFALFLVALAILRWLSDAAGISNYSDVGAGLPFRVLNSGEAFVISIGAFIFLIQYIFNFFKRKYLCLSLLCFACVLILQHRSVWLSTIAAIILLLIYGTINQKSNLFKFLSAFLMVVCVTSIFFLLANPEGRLRSSIGQSYTGALDTEEGTHVDRILGWKYLLSEWTNSNLIVWVVGYPYGKGYERYTFGILRDYSPHNFYVQLLLRVGVLGTLSCFACFFASFFFFYKRKSQSIEVAGVISIMLICSLVYFISYQGNFFHGVILGIALSMKNSLIKKENMI